MKITFKKTLTLLGLLGSLIWLAAFSFPDQKLHLIFCDVGQGDAIFMTKGFSQMLVDGGPSDKVLSCLKNNMPFFDRTIEAVALTHPEADHLTGLLSVFDKYKIDYFLTGPAGNNSAVYQELIGKLEARGFCKGTPCREAKRPLIKVVNPYTGDRIKIGNLVLETLWPEKKWITEKLESNIVANRNDQNISSAVLGVQTGNLKLNQFSLVFLLKYKSFQAILMGDADRTVQKDIVLYNNLMPLDILKYPHHGSKTGMDKTFLELIKPKEAVISVGKNSYGHPTTEALDLLKSERVKIRRTDLEGEIKYVF